MSDADAALQRSLQRLEHSRQALRATLLPPPAPERARGDGLLPQRWREWLRDGPVGPVLRTLDPWWGGAQRTLVRWWRRHPWRPTAELAGGAFERGVVPWVRAHPLSAVVLGAGVGAALAVAAPWRWVALQQAVRGSGRSARRWALRQLTSPAAQTLLASAVAALWTSRAQTTSRQATAPAEVRTEDAATGV